MTGTLRQPERVVLPDGSAMLIRPLPCAFARRPAARVRRRHDALGAYSPADRRRVGVARYVRHPDNPQVARVVVSVAADWRDRGLESELLTRLGRRATRDGVARFVARVPVEDRGTVAGLQSINADVVRIDHGTAEVSAPLGGVPCELCGKAQAPDTGADLDAAPTSDLRWICAECVRSRIPRIMDRLQAAWWN